jgi:acetoin utilization deacetylase AcuC-like enzyme
MIKIAYSDRFVLDLPEGHKFPMIKYELLVEQLLYEGTITPDNLYDPGLVGEETILLTHTPEYWKKLTSEDFTEREIRRIGFPMSQKLIKRSRSSAYGTVNAALNALNYGVAFNSAGGTHHAYSNKGEAFCLMNDIGIAANYLLHHKKAEKILVVDLDVHQGNGTAEIFANTSDVFTFSMHGADNYPLKKESSDLDIPLSHHVGDHEYLTILKDTLPQLIADHKPDFIFFLAGVDVLSSDRLGKLNLSKDGCKQRDEYVFEQCINHEIPVAVSMGGGYSPRVADIIDAHCNTYRLAFNMFDHTS